MRPPRARPAPRLRLPGRPARAAVGEAAPAPNRAHHVPGSCCAACSPAWHSRCSCHPDLHSRRGKLSALSASMSNVFTRVRAKRHKTLLPYVEVTAAYYAVKV